MHIRANFIINLRHYVLIMRVTAVKAEAVELHTMLPIKIPTPGMVAQMARMIARPANVPGTVLIPSRRVLLYKCF